MANIQRGVGNVDQSGDGDKTNVQIINVTPPPDQPPNPPEGGAGAKGLDWRKIVEAVIVAAIVGGGVFYIGKNIIVVGDGNNIGNVINNPSSDSKKSAIRGDGNTIIVEPGSSIPHIRGDGNTIVIRNPSDAELEAPKAKDQQSRP